MPVLNYCCNISLRTGTLIIGVLGFILSLLDFIILMADVKIKDAPAMHEQFGKEYTVVMEVFHLTVSALLLVGVLTRRPMLLLPYIVSSAIGIALICIVMLYILFATGNIIIVIAILIFLSFGAYLTLVVFSYYQFLKEGEVQSQLPPPCNATTPLTAAFQPPFQPQPQPQPYYSSEQGIMMTTQQYPQK